MTDDSSMTATKKDPIGTCDLIPSRDQLFFLYRSLWNEENRIVRLHDSGSGLVQPEMKKGQ